MHKATLVSRSQISGEYTHIIENDDLIQLYAETAGAVEGITSAGSVIVSLVIDKVVSA